MWVYQKFSGGRHNCSAERPGLAVKGKDGEESVGNSAACCCLQTKEILSLRHFSYREHIIRWEYSYQLSSDSSKKSKFIITMFIEELGVIDQENVRPS